MTQGFMYMLVGLKHASVLAVSIRSLREHWDGPILLVAGCPSSEELCHKIRDATDGEVLIEVWNAPTRKTMEGAAKGIQYANKTLMHHFSPFEKTIFLDADTMVLGPPTQLFPKDDEVHVTQFANWVTNESPVRGRIEGWRQWSSSVAMMQANPIPAINTGVIGFSRTSRKFFEAWQTLTHKNLCFICDEIACQLMFHKHPHEVHDDRWNWSPNHSPRALEDDVRIAHFHGKKHMKVERARALWWPAYVRAYAENFAEIQTWSPGSDRRLRQWLATYPDFQAELESATLSLEC